MSDDDLVTKLSPLSVPETVARLSEVLAEKGVKLFAVIDHSGEAAAAGLELRDTKVVIFGAPKAGTPVMQAVPVAALDLPLKVLVWADGDQTKLTYTAPAALAARYGLEGRAGSTTRRDRPADRRGRRELGRDQTASASRRRRRGTTDRFSSSLRSCVTSGESARWRSSISRQWR